MKNKILKIAMLMVFFLAILGVTKSVQANSISKISMDIYIDQNGDASVTETWICSTNSGTEVYHPYYNLGNSKITDLRVSEGSRQYTRVKFLENIRNLIR